MRDNLSIIKASYEAGSHGDIVGIMADLNEDTEWIEMAGGPYAGNYRGPKAILENVFGRIKTDWDTFECRPGEFYDAGNSIIMTGWYRGMHAKTRRTLEVRVTHVWKLNNGIIIKFEQFVDTALMLKAINL